MLYDLAKSLSDVEWVFLAILLCVGITILLRFQR